MTEGMDVGRSVSSVTGTRMPDSRPRDYIDWPAGAYGRAGSEWMIVTPNGLPGMIPSITHTVIEHDDGTITVKPSIVCAASAHHSGFHGFLQRGVWTNA